MRYLSDKRLTREDLMAQFMSQIEDPIWHKLWERGRGQLGDKVWFWFQIEDQLEENCET